MNASSQTTVEQCGSKPNCVSSTSFDFPENEQPSWAIEPLGYDHRTVEGKIAFEKLVDILKDENMILEINYPKINAVATTKIFGYKDDLTFLLLEDQGIIHIRSESRKGYYDFGKNRRRLETIRNKFIIEK